MFKRVDPAMVGGLILILAGTLYLLQNMGMLENAGDMFWGGIFLAAGVLFLFPFLTGAWWAIIPSLALAGIGVLIILPDSPEKFGGAVFLGAIGAAFWLVFFTAPRGRWWAIIPAGVLTTIAAVSFLPEAVGGIDTSAIFFFGLAITFALVALLTGMRWGWYPAGALGLVGVLIVLAAEEMTSYMMAVVLILSGAYLLYRYFRHA